jgi:hypothetical protein
VFGDHFKDAGAHPYFGDVLRRDAHAKY